MWNTKRTFIFLGKTNIIEIWPSALSITIWIFLFNFEFKFQSKNIFNKQYSKWTNFVCLFSFQQKKNPYENTAIISQNKHISRMIRLLRIQITLCLFDDWKYKESYVAEIKLFFRENIAPNSTFWCIIIELLNGNWFYNSIKFAENKIELELELEFNVKFYEQRFNSTSVWMKQIDFYWNQ